MTYEQFHPNEPDEKNLRWLAALSGLFSLLGIGGMLVGQLYLKRCDRKSWFIYGGVVVGAPIVIWIIGRSVGDEGGVVWGLFSLIGLIAMIVGTIKKRCGRDEWLVYGGAWAGVIIPIGAILLIGGVERTESQRTEPQQTIQNTPRPARNLQNISATKLYEERENNATRFDHTYKNKRININGSIERIDNDTVYLDTGYFDGVALRGFPTRRLLDLNSGNNIRAECTVGNYILGRILLNDCR